MPFSNLCFFALILSQTTPLNLPYKKFSLAKLFANQSSKCKQ